MLLCVYRRDTGCRLGILTCLLAMTQEVLKVLYRSHA